MAAAALAAFYLSYLMSDQERWEPAARSHERAKTRKENPARDLSTGRLIASSLIAGALVIAAGIVLAWTGEAIAVQSGLGSGFVGAVFLAIATSLPEITTSWTAVRLGRFGMAFANIFGTNILDLSFVFLADLAFPGDAVLAHTDNVAPLAALLGLGLTLLYLVGILVRPRRLILGMGLDSLSVLAVYGCGLLMLYVLR